MEFLEKFSANDFALPDVEDNTVGQLNRGSVADLLLWRTLLAFWRQSHELSLLEVIHSCFISIRKFGIFKNPFSRITSLFVQTKEINFMSYDFSSSRSTKFKNILSWSLFILKLVPISMRVTIICDDKGHPLFSLE